MPFPSIRSSREHPPGGLGLAAAVVALLGGTALAAPSESEAVRQAREHYKKGEEAYAAARWEDAYREFEAGYSLASKPVFLLNMAHSQRRRGDLRNARALYQKFLLVEPQSRYGSEVQQVIQELDAAIAAEDAARAAAPDIPAAAIALPPPAPTAIVLAPLPPPPERPLYRRWWVWAAAGAVVAGTVATTLLLSRSSYQKDGTLGTLGGR
jgi:hypothetical protein